MEISEILSQSPIEFDKPTSSIDHGYLLKLIYLSLNKQIKATISLYIT